MRSETEIIDRLIDGQHSALEELMLSYQNYVYSILAAMLYKHEAEEAAQDTFIKIYKNIRQYNRQSKLTTWMYRIAYRTGLDYLKRRKRHRSLEEVITHTEGTETPDHMGLTDMRHWLNQEINSLDPTDASLIRLYYLNEHNIQEVADITGLTVSNVKIKLYRSRNRLKERMSHLKLTDLIS